MTNTWWKALAIGAAAIAISSSAVLADQHEACGIDLTEATPDGVISGEVKSVGYLVGLRWGNGVLTLSNGERHRFSILGAKLLETGVAKNVISGEVYNLNSLADFEGTYFGAAKKISIVKSKGEAVANNKQCVVVKLRSVGHGLQLSGPAPGGVEISLFD